MAYYFMFGQIFGPHSLHFFNAAVETRTALLILLPLVSKLYRIINPSSVTTVNQTAAN
jgi:hypothetical protein